MLDIYVIGCGGIGGYLLQLLPAALVSCTLDIIQQRHPGKSSELLEQGGNIFIPSIANRLVLIDGDSFDPHNAIRQVAGAGSKLAVQTQLLQSTMLKQVWLRQMQLFGIDTYIKPANIAQIIPQELQTTFPYQETDNARAQYNGAFYSWLDRTMGYSYCPARSQLSSETRRATYSLMHSYNKNIKIQSIPVVFLCVDNHKTRYEVQRYMQTFQDCILINGGNSKLAGNATIYQKKAGVQLDPKIYQLYPEIANGTSKRPDELSCTEMSRQHDQIAIVNSMLASIMCNLFRKAVTPTDSLYTQAARNKPAKRLNEVIVQCSSMTMVPMYHKPRTQEGDAQK